MQLLQGQVLEQGARLAVSAGLASQLLYALRQGRGARRAWPPRIPPSAAACAWAMQDAAHTYDTPSQPAVNHISLVT